jgi:hypothetical protein
LLFASSSELGFLCGRRCHLTVSCRNRRPGRLVDADKYLRRGSLWEAHNRLHEARHHIWALWAAAAGALYPWHGLSQVLDHDPGDLPPGIESTVAGLDTADLRRAACASATLLAKVSASAAQQCPADLPSAMASYVTHALSHDR